MRDVVYECPVQRRWGGFLWGVLAALAFTAGVVSLTVGLDKKVRAEHPSVVWVVLAVFGGLTLASALTYLRSAFVLRVHRDRSLTLEQRGRTLRLAAPVTVACGRTEDWTETNRKGQRQTVYWVSVTSGGETYVFQSQKAALEASSWPEAAPPAGAERFSSLALRPVVLCDSLRGP